MLNNLFDYLLYIFNRYAVSFLSIVHTILYIIHYFLLVLNKFNVLER